MVTPSYPYGTGATTSGYGSYTINSNAQLTNGNYTLPNSQSELRAPNSQSELKATIARLTHEKEDLETKLKATKRQLDKLTKDPVELLKTKVKNFRLEN